MISLGLFFSCRHIIAKAAKACGTRRASLALCHSAARWMTSWQRREISDTNGKASKSQVEQNLPLADANDRRVFKGETLNKKVKINQSIKSRPVVSDKMQTFFGA